VSWYAVDTQSGCTYHATMNDDKPTTTQVAIRLPCKVLDTLDALADELGLTRSALIRHVLVDHCRRHPVQPPLPPPVRSAE
jgi:hypothetical protein